MIVSCDAAQLEWRTVLELSQDQTGIKETLDGQDTHDLNRVEFRLPSRLVAKIYLFRTIFRGSGWSFANDPDFSHVSSSPEFWDEINGKFFKKYGGIDRKHKEWADLVMAGRPIQGPLGRKWMIPLSRDRRGEIKIPWTVLTNYPVQGTGADIMALARVSYANKVKKYKLPVQLIQTVHDDIKTDSPEKYVRNVVELYHESFQGLQKNIKNIFGYDWIVPLKCECKVGMNMKDMENYNL
jgi:DNA polymerase-1